ncbi:MAG TPA: thermonuclease family protein [Vicinamibacterales bacterium]|nr:thermonuclease family protein [Vicinamibacterales bacterium]
MQILPMVTLVGVAIVQSWSPTPKIVRSDPVLVRSVVDGDTIDVVGVGRVRLLGIDAPELGRVYDTTAPFAKEARDRLTALVLHRWVRLEQDGQSLDAYSRHLAYVLTEDGQFVNATLVREGLARVTARVALARLPELQRAEAEAQSFRRGMWGGMPQVPSTGYTRPGASGATRKQPAQRTKKKKSSK